MKTLNLRGWRLAVAGACVIALGTGVAAQKISINGAGATFPDPIYQKWFSEYNKLNPNVQINYQAVGSGAGVRQLTAMTVFFGASDAAMTNDQLLAAPDKVLHFPTVLGAVVPIYNLQGNPPDLKFTGQILSDIFLGKVTKWNDASIAAANPGVTLPGSAITVVHRAEGSGTTYIFCDFLAKVVPEWKTKVGVGTAPRWPVGVGGAGNDGVTAQVKQIPGAIGYVELVYALQNKLSYGQVKNKAGNFVKASIESTTAAAAAAAASMKTVAPDFRVSITNPDGPAAYPIASFTWLLMYESPKDKVKSKTMVDFLKWALADGQKFAAELGYAPLPAPVIALELEQLKKVKIQ